MYKYLPAQRYTTPLIFLQHINTYFCSRFLCHLIIFLFIPIKLLVKLRVSNTQKYVENLINPFVVVKNLINPLKFFQWLHHFPYKFIETKIFSSDDEYVGSRVLIFLVDWVVLETI
jgi:hypothetical protein